MQDLVLFIAAVERLQLYQWIVHFKDVDDILMFMLRQIQSYSLTSAFQAVSFKNTFVQICVSLFYRIVQNVLINFQRLQMLNPTFASFKTAKQPLTHTTALAEVNLNIQPRTFHELKTSSNIIKQGPQSHLQQQHLPERINFNHNNQMRKTPLSFNLRKNNSEANFLQNQGRNQAGENIKSKSKLNSKNYVTTRKNFAFIQKSSKDKYLNRPSITGPSLLKNKSFIYTHKNQGKENYLSRPSHDCSKGPYLYTQQTSIDSMDRKSQDISISIGSSNGDKDSYSFFNSSKLQDSLNMKDSCNSGGKMDRTLNFSRKSNQTIYKGDQNKIKAEQDSIDASSLCSMARELQSSYEQEKINIEPAPKKSFDNASINFSKKFQNYRRPKENLQVKSFTIEQFEMLQQMGQGKYGKVFMARHIPTGFICALKTLSKAKIKEQNIEQPLIREIKIQMYLNHPNIVKLYGFFHNKDNLFLIMECCLSGHLLKLMKQRKIFEQSEILEIISNVYEAVSFLHCHGIIHRDLKPQNIVIQQGVYKICDFGWAAYAKGDTRTTFCGTPLYVCPEVLKGNQYDAKADVWGLGVLTYELAYGRVPFPIWSQTDMIKIIKDPVYFPSWTSVSEKMQNLIKSMLNKDPAKRLSLNEVLSNSLIAEYFGARYALRSQIQSLF